jgi:hypothetical protein
VFENPFDFPMTTAPASVLQNGEFLGQQTANWVNSGVETSVRVNKALSIEGRLSEEEQAQTRQSITSLNRNGYRVEVLGTVMVTNRRSTAVEMHINRQFSGELLAADANPELSLLESGVYSLNRRNALEWRFELAAGETRTLTYRYEVFVI